jgi:hypothetical protein
MRPATALLVCGLLGAACLLPGPASRAAAGEEAAAGGSDTVWERTIDADLGRLRSLNASDVTGDGSPEVILAVGGRGAPVTVSVIDADSGSRLWRRVLASGGVVAPVRDGPRGPGCIVAGSGDTLLVLEGATGAVVRKARLPAIVGDVTAGDLTGDGRDEVVCTSGVDINGTVTCWDSGSLELLWRVSCPPADGRYDDGYALPVVLDDVGGRGAAVFLREHSTILLRLDAAGDTVWRATLGEKSGLVPRGRATTAPAAVDVDGAGHRDLAVGTIDGTVLLLDSDSGDVLSSRVFGGEEHSAYADRRRFPKALRRLLLETGEPCVGFAAAAADPLRGDELFFTTANGMAHGYSPGRNEILWKQRLEGDIASDPIAARTGDGRPCVVQATTEQVAVLDATTGRELDGTGSISGCTDLLLRDFLPDRHLQALVWSSRDRTLSLVRTRLVPSGS